MVALATAVTSLVHAEKVISHLAQEMGQVSKSTPVVMEAVNKKNNPLALF